MKMDELTRLRQLLSQISNMPPPTPTNMPSGPEHLKKGYEVGWVNGWVAYRQALKRALYPSGGG